MRAHVWCTTPYVKRFGGHDLFAYTCIRCGRELLSDMSVPMDSPEFGIKDEDCDEILVRQVMDS